MKQSRLWNSLALGMALATAAGSSAFAQSAHHRERPLTITRHAGAEHRGTGIEYRDNGREIIAWGGFSANGYGYGHMGPEAARRAARNDSVHYATGGVYGYGFDGLGGTGFDDDLHSGYNNPNYGNAYSSYVGYGGVPTNLAFGPAFANRHITDHEDDDDDADVPGPTPRELGYAASPFDIDADD